MSKVDVAQLRNMSRYRSTMFPEALVGRDVLDELLDGWEMVGRLAREYRNDYRSYELEAAVAAAEALIE